MADQKISLNSASSRPASVSPWIVRFYACPSTVEDFRGRTLKDILGKDNADLHHSDDYLHLLFPTGQRTPPVVNHEVALAFRSRPVVKGNFRNAFGRMMTLYGYGRLENSAGKLILQRLPDYLEQQHPATDWLSKSSKHHSRIERILLSLRLLGLEEEAKAFHAALCREETAMVVNEVYFRNWALAIEVDLTRWIGSMETTKDESGHGLQDKPDTTKEKAKTIDTRRPSQERKDYASALPSWNIEPLPAKLDIRPVFGPSIILSPLAPGGIDAYCSTLPGTMVRHFPKLVATLWYSIYEEYKSGNAQIRALAAQLDHQGHDALICYLNARHDEPASKAHPTLPTTGPHFEIVSLPDTIHPPAITPLTDFFKLVGRKDLGSELNIPLQILESNASGCLDSFIINPSYAYFRVNGVSVPPSTLAGPLPNFAIIEADNAVVFWWRDREACDYVPALLAKPGRKRSHGESEDDGGAAEEPLSPKKRQKLNDELRKLTGRYMAIPPPDTRAGLLHHRLLRHRAAQRLRPNAIGLRRSEELLDDAVVNGIAAFWIPLARSGKMFAFGRTDLFTHCRTQEGQENFQMTACGVESESFIMPLYFNAMDIAKIAEKVEQAGKEEKGSRYRLRPRSQTTSPSAGKGKKATSATDPGKKDDPKAKGKGAKNGRSTNDSTSSSGNKEPDAPQNPKAKPPSTPPSSRALKSPSPTLQATQGIPMGHHLLAIATRPSPLTHPTQITLHVHDSAPGHIPRSTIHAAATGLVTHTGWLGLTPLGEPNRSLPPPTFTPLHARVPLQSGANSCGLYAILNAWAWMLGIEVYGTRGGSRSQGRRRAGCGAAGVFEELAREVVDLAMGGKMSAETVRNFLVVFGYAEGGVGLGVGEGRDGGEGEGAVEGGGEVGAEEGAVGMDDIEAVRLEGTRNGQEGTLESELTTARDADLLAEVMRASLRDG